MFNTNKKDLLEGLTQQTNITYKNTNLNSPLYSHSVNLPINSTLNCNNFCGPKAQCAITREQCSTDVDCVGCNTTQTTTQNQPILDNIVPFDATGKLGQQGLQYSPLTTGVNGHNIDFAEIYPGSKDAQIIQPYAGIDNWIKPFNAGLELYNNKRENIDKLDKRYSGLTFEPKYPMKTSATGLFYETTPPAANATLPV